MPDQVRHDKSGTGRAAFHASVGVIAGRAAFHASVGVIAGSIRNPGLGKSWMPDQVQHDKSGMTSSF